MAKKENEEKTTEETPQNKSGNLVVLSDKPDENAKWYVIHTYSGHEKRVAKLLEEKVWARGFENKIFKIFIPTQQKIVISEGKKRKVDDKLYPGYIIINMIMTDDSWYLVRSTKGVTGFIGTGSTPISDAEVSTLMKYTKMEAPKFEAKFSVGDSIKITDGPFMDFLGKVEEVNEDQGKVRVLVSVFGRETPVELDFMQVTNI